MQKDKKLLSLLLQTLFLQESYLDDQEKSAFPLINRCLLNMDEIWSSNRQSLYRVNVMSISSTALLIQINSLEAVTFNSPVEREVEYAH